MNMAGKRIYSNNINMHHQLKGNICPPFPSAFWPLLHFGGPPAANNVRTGFGIVFLFAQLDQQHCCPPKVPTR